MLIGISLGPGDPGLLTLKAVDALRRCSKVFVPGEMAVDLVKPYSLPEVLDFPMISDPGRLEEIWARNADHVAEFAKAGDAGFACIGDVNTFSTFTHLKRLVSERHPEVEVDTIPGVGVIPAMASRFGVGLDQSFEVSDGSEIGAVIRMKATRPREAALHLKERGFDEFTLGIRLSTPEEEIIRAAAEEMPERSDYFSVLLARRRGSGSTRRMI